MPSSSPQLISPINSRLARQLIASAPDAAQQLSEELGGQSWSEIDISWLQDELAKKLGYVIVDWTRLSQRDVAYAAIDLHRLTCVEKVWPLVVVFMGLHCCTVQIDTSDAGRRCARLRQPHGADLPSRSRRLLMR